MKKIIKFLTLILSLVLITGCVSEKSRNNIIKELTSKKVIDKNWTFVDMVEEKSWWSLIPVKNIHYYDYVYKNNNAYYNVKIDNNYDYDGNDKSKTYKISIYKSTSIEEIIPHPEDQEGYYYVYQNKEGLADNNIYDVDSVLEKEYTLKVTPKKFLFFRWNKNELTEIN